MSDDRKRKIIRYLFFPLAILVMELFSHFWLFGLEFTGVFKIILFSLLLGSIITLASSFFKESGFNVFGIVTLALLGFIHSVQIVYHGFFHSFFMWGTLSMAGDLTQFWREALIAVLKSTPALIILFLPMILFIIFRKPIWGENDVQRKPLAVLTCILLLIFIAVTFIPKENRQICLFMQNDPPNSFKNYGIVFSSAMDVYSTVFGVAEESVVNPYESLEAFAPNVEEATEIVEYNSLDIDFAWLTDNCNNSKIKEMHEYFATVPATEKNEYTGIFKGKNLIFLCLEGFSYKAIDESFTPILHKMYTEGFRFNNFYDSLWGGSTATGEYAVMTGNFYSKANCIEKSARTNQRYALGNLFKYENYKTYAYHNHSYSYYSRHKSHPNFGYDVYKAIGNGLKLESNLWPNSDEEMAIATVDEYIYGEKPFHAYYMTVSGHANYNWGGNNMSERNKEAIPSEWTYSENIKAYYSCQYEVEKMLRVLMEKLEEAGVLEDTVFAMCCDHYPYALTDKELSELYQLEEKGIRSNFDLYRNAFILWTPSMAEPIEVDKPCSSYDILPTIANLFGIEYDSRLVTGKDIMSAGENIVVLNTLGNGSSWNWITEKGQYDAYSGVFTPCVDMSEDEAESYKEITIQKVNAMRKYSFGILDNNYYSYVFDENGEVIKPLE